jgi:hypothetical protein
MVRVQHSVRHSMSTIKRNLTSDAVTGIRRSTSAFTSPNFILTSVIVRIHLSVFRHVEESVESSRRLELNPEFVRATTSPAFGFSLSTARGA